MEIKPGDTHGEVGQTDANGHTPVRCHVTMLTTNPRQLGVISGTT